MNELQEHKEAERLGVVWPFPRNGSPVPMTKKQIKQDDKEALWQMPEALF